MHFRVDPKHPDNSAGSQWFEFILKRLHLSWLDVNDVYLSCLLHSNLTRLSIKLRVTARIGAANAFRVLYYICILFFRCMPLTNTDPHHMLESNPFTELPDLDLSNWSGPSAIGSSTNVNYASGSAPIDGALSQQQPLKKEPLLRNWFSSSSSPSAAPPPSVPAPILPLDLRPSSPLPIEPHQSEARAISPMPVSPKQSPGAGSMESGSPPSSMNVTAISTNGDQSNHKLTHISVGKPAASHEQQQSQQPPKSSRRTTSLLNLFMSNSQGMNVLQHIFPTEHFTTLK